MINLRAYPGFSLGEGALPELDKLGKREFSMEHHRLPPKENILIKVLENNLSFFTVFPFFNIIFLFSIFFLGIFRKIQFFLTFF